MPRRETSWMQGETVVRITSKRDQAFQPLVARHRSIACVTGPVVFACVKIVLIREGCAELFGEFRRHKVGASDVVILSPNVLFGAIPDERMTYSVVTIDVDYLIEQVFWRYSARLSDRLDAAGFAAELYPQPVQVIHMQHGLFGQFRPLLDELVELSVSDRFTERFNRIQSLWFGIADPLSPCVAVAPEEALLDRKKHIRTAVPPARRLAPFAPTCEQLHIYYGASPSKAWTLQELATAVHLSKYQLQAVFAEVMGKTPFEYLRTVRVERMAKYLRESQLPIDLLKSEQSRIQNALTAIQTRLDGLHSRYADARTGLEGMLQILTDLSDLYMRCEPSERRFLNQALFAKIIVDEEENVAPNAATAVSTVISQKPAAQIGCYPGDTKLAPCSSGASFNFRPLRGTALLACKRTAEGPPSPLDQASPRASAGERWS